MKLSSPFFHHALPTNRLMLLVCLALLPGAFIQIYFFGFGVLINLLSCALFAIGAEYFVLYLRKRNPLTTLKDNSALLTGLLLGLALPPTLPIWMTLIGVSFAIIFAKQLYGGLGFNPFNPAMTGYVLLLISFPVEMTSWMPSREISLNFPTFIESLQLILFSETSSGHSAEFYRNIADGFTMATPLDYTKTEFTLGHMTSEIFSQQNFSNNLNGWMWVNIGFLLGGIYLLVSKIIRWHIPFSFLLGITITSQALHTYDSQLYTPTWFHLITGATMLGAFFIATDPVSATTTPKGRIIYGLLIGFLVVIIRTFGGYPEAVAFAILLLNLATPMIDHYTKPIVYGHKSESSND
ncbi:electron transport complex subunit RsxD [Aliikangiella sp. IMCC44359]|uniref:electron transport complex subunit RsxD n=1 Tax=Aliikangiella sp. IMCC44359 TaxID=3459125 RepID=UPI00403A8AE5